MIAAAAALALATSCLAESMHPQAGGSNEGPVAAEALTRLSVKTADDLARLLEGTLWSWGTDANSARSKLHFLKEGVAIINNDPPMRWTVIDASTVKLSIGATIKFSADYSRYDGAKTSGGARAGKRLASTPDKRSIVRQPPATDNAGIPTPARADAPAFPAGETKRRIALEKGWDGRLQGGDATREDLATLFNKHGKPSQDTNGDSSILVYEKVKFLMPVEEARGILRLSAKLPSKIRIGCPGLPRDSLSYYAFDGLFEGHYNRLHLVVDSADQVLSVLLVDEAPRAKDIRVENMGFHTYNFIDYRSKAMRDLVIEHKVSKVSPGVHLVESRLFNPSNATAAATAATTNRNPKAQDGAMLEESRWYVPQPLVNLILRCVEGR